MGLKTNLLNAIADSLQDEIADFESNIQNGIDSFTDKMVHEGVMANRDLRSGLVEALDAILNMLDDIEDRYSNALPKKDKQCLAEVYDLIADIADEYDIEGVVELGDKDKAKPKTKIKVEKIENSNEEVIEAEIVDEK